MFLVVIGYHFGIIAGKTPLNCRIFNNRDDITPWIESIQKSGGIISFLKVIEGNQLIVDKENS